MTGSAHALHFAPPEPPAEQRRDLVGLSRDALAEEMAALGEKPFRARQLWHWIYHRGETDFAAMTTLSKAFRDRLAERYVIARPAVAADQRSTDGTRKWLLRFPDGQEVESVFIPEEDRGTLCISSQVGCTLTCTFCHTGTQRLVRNLTAGEIAAARLADQGRVFNPQQQFAVTWPATPVVARAYLDQLTRAGRLQGRAADELTAALERAESVAASGGRDRALSRSLRALAAEFASDSAALSETLEALAASIR